MRAAGLLLFVVFLSSCLFDSSGLAPGGPAADTKVVVDLTGDGPAKDLPRPKGDLPRPKGDLPGPKGDLPGPKPDLPGPKPDLPGPKPDLPLPDQLQPDTGGPCKSSCVPPKGPVCCDKGKGNRCYPDKLGCKP